VHGAARAPRDGALSIRRHALPAAGAAFALMLTGCAPSTPSWTKPGVTVRQLEADRDECLARSVEYLATGESRPNYAALEQCMAMKGYAAQRTR
jgi:hypothetical protein